MFYMVFAGICLAASVATPTIYAQLDQNPIGLGFVLPTVAKLPGFTGSPSEGGWPAPQPPTPASADCPLSSIVSGACPAVNGATPTYLESYLCGCFFECSNGVPYPFKCPATLQFNPLINVCADYSNECVIPTTTTPAPTPRPAFPSGCPYEDVSRLCPSDGTPANYASRYCGCYYRCSNGIATSYRCLILTQQFDSSKNECVAYFDPSCEPVPV